MTRLHATIASVVLLTAAVYAQQTRLTNVAATVTNDVLRHTGAANDPFAGSWH